MTFTPSIEIRKKHHLELASFSQLAGHADQRFDFEPLFNAHPTLEDLKTTFLGKNLKAPLWISSMTGGTESAFELNTRLARASRRFGLGFALGSCRPLMENEERFMKDFSMRSIIGPELPFYANFGAVQLHQYLNNDFQLKRLNKLLSQLEVDGLIIHVNVLQEWFQQDGDRYPCGPLEIIQNCLDKLPYPIIVKEVGQGFGPESLRKLMELPLAALEFGAFGGTNFTKLENLRQPDQDDNQSNWANEFAHIGQSAEKMLDDLLAIENEKDHKFKCKNIIISGGVRTPLEAHYLLSKALGLSGVNSVIGQAYPFMLMAQKGESQLDNYIENFLKHLALAKAYLKLKRGL